jgi:hypothetical protein
MEPTLHAAATHTEQTKFWLEETHQYRKTTACVNWESPET